MKTFLDHICESLRKRIGDQIPVRSIGELDALAVAASRQHKGKYILAYVDFGLATMFVSDRLPTNAYASDDWRLGYWRDGKHYNWSDARKRATQRAVDRLSGTQ